MSTMTGAQGEAMTAGERHWLIWSEAHGAWWKPEQGGYTRSMREAGRYRLADAIVIALDANRALPEGRLKDVLVVDPMLLQPMRGAS